MYFGKPNATEIIINLFICILYKHIIYIYIYIYDQQSQLTTSLFLNFFTTCFGPYGPSSGENVYKIDVNMFSPEDGP
jgi:hypothetical protein